MKIYISIILFSISLISFSQTESETIIFLNTKFNEHKVVASFGTSFQSIKVEGIDGTPKSITIFTLLKRFPDPDMRFTYKFYPITINSIIAKTAPNGKTKNIIITSEIKNISVWDDVSYQYSKPTDIHPLVLDCDEKEINRIKKALIHLFKNNGATLQADELFKD